MSAFLRCEIIYTEVNIFVLIWTRKALITKSKCNNYNDSSQVDQ